MKVHIIFAVFVLVVGHQTVYGAFGHGSDRVLLKDIQVLTLRSGQMTNGRRSSPVPQLKCIGGTAGCSAFKPQVVQCYNRGSDGYDVQWECKTDMDNAYRFGNVEVTCEGYDYPDDPYILRGSCGLEYTIDLTKEGYQQQGQGHHDYYGQQQQHYQNPYMHKQSSGFSTKAGSVMGDLVFLAIVAIIIYAIYKTCLARNNDTYNAADDNDRRDRWRNDPPPPYGFRDEYMPRGGDSCSSSNTGGYTHTGTAGNAGTGTGGFWTGAATGGILGYLFGSRNNTYYGSRTYASPYNTGWGTGWGNGWGNGWGTGWGRGWGTGWGNTRQSTGFSTSFSRSSGSTGTRTASGFGGTKRR